MCMAVVFESIYQTWEKYIAIIGQIFFYTEICLIILQVLKWFCRVHWVLNKQKKKYEKGNTKLPQVWNTGHFQII